jgi:hypothetical protein
MKQEGVPSLLPCPFCGQPACVTDDDSYGGCGVGCNCDPEPYVHRAIGKLDEAAEVWNRRVQSLPAEPRQTMKSALETVLRGLDTTDGLYPIVFAALYPNLRLAHPSRASSGSDTEEVTGAEDHPGNLAGGASTGFPDTEATP